MWGVFAWVVPLVAGEFVVLCALVFAAAGTWRYPPGWVFAGVTASLMVVSLVAMRQHVELLRERVRPGPGTKSWDRILVALIAVGFFAALVVPALDRGRLHLTPALSLPWSLVGAVLYSAGWLGMLWAMRVNPFFSSVVRIQTDRGQFVVDTGPYALVRHPGYAAALLLLVGIPLTLGSLLGLLPSAFVGGILVVRTVLEDATLKAELAGYPAYAERVRYRLVPGIW